MVFDHIEKLKREYTDKYVVVDAGQPELRRFDGQTGMIKTVNMNGSALVEFDGLNNIGWFDIALECLKVVDKPLPKEEPKKAAAKKPAAKAVPAKPAPGKATPAKPPAAGGGMSVADMLAAARGEKGAEAKTDAKPAAAAPTPTPAGGAKMSVAEMLAAARGEKSGGGAPAPSVAEPEPEPVAEETPEADPEAEAAPAGDIPTDIPGILAYCRKVDG